MIAQLDAISVARCLNPLLLDLSVHTIGSSVMSLPLSPLSRSALIEAVDPLFRSPRRSIRRTGDFGRSTRVVPCAILARAQRGSTGTCDAYGAPAEVLLVEDIDEQLLASDGVLVAVAPCPSTRPTGTGARRAATETTGRLNFRRLDMGPVTRLSMLGKLLLQIATTGGAICRTLEVCPTSSLSLPSRCSR